MKSNFTVVPIMVGELKGDGGVNYGKILSPYLEDPENLFVISSDFCHWGELRSFIIYGLLLNYMIQVLDSATLITIRNAERSTNQLKLWIGW